ncbi:MAG: twin-arginine translocase subunit TatC [candidate division Zixibacteria bacterium]|nr:twin-arginine translocase subunit TatC [candidate division Zixibacteria bacterium]
MNQPPEIPDNSRDEHTFGGLPFLDHLEELRWRLVKAILAVVVMAGAAFYFRDQLFDFLVIPLGEIQLHFTEITGSFYAYLKVSLITGIFFAAPIVFYQMWAFVSPGLYKREKSVAYPLVLVSTLLFMIGAGFCYYIVLPLALKFLVGFSEGLITPIITVGSYLSFAGLLLIAFGVGFELPVVAYMLGRMGIISAPFLTKGRRYAIVAILVAGAIITPPDVFTQVLLAGPVYLLYEVSIIVVRVTDRRRKRETEESEI